MEPTLDRNAWIAYMYDVYSVEQAIAQIELDIELLKEDEVNTQEKLKRAITKFKQERENLIRQLEIDYGKENKEVSIKQKPLTVGVVTASTIFFIVLFLLKKY